MRTGNFSAIPGLTLADPFTGLSTGAGRTTFTNNIIPSSLINPAAAGVMNALPMPNEPGFEYNYFANVPVVNDGNRADARLDQHFSDKAAAFLRYGLSYYNTDLYSALGPAGADAGASRLRADEAAAGWTQTFGPTTFMELRAGYNRYSDPIGSLYGPLSAGAYGLTGTNLPEVSIQGMTPFGTNPNYPQINKEQTFEAANDWHARFFNQDLRFGVDAWWIRTDGFQNLLFGPAGGYTFTAGATSLPTATIGPYSDFANSFAAFLLGAPTTAGITTSHYVPSYLEQQYGGYIADRVQAGSKLTLDLGVRYDFFRQLEPRNNANMYSIFNPMTATLVPLGGSAANRYGDVLANTLNFAPRFGAAYRFDDRTVIRAGYGWAYWNPSMLFAASTLIPQMTYVQAGVAGSYATVGPFGTFPSTTTTSGRAPDATYFFSPSRVRTPYVQMYNFDVQRDMTHGMLVDLAYVGNVGRELPYTQDLNAALPGTGVSGMAFAPYGLTAPIFERGTGFNSNYNSLQVNLTKRFSQGISFVAAYTYSKSLDNGAGLMPFLNNSSPWSNYGPSNFDQTHVLTVTHNIRLPFGTGTQFLNHGWVGRVLGPWELDGIFRYGTGFPFTPTASAAMCGCPGNTATALVSPGPTYLGYSLFPSFFGFFPYTYLIQTTQYSQPAAGTLGNVGRNSLRGPNLTNYDLALSRSFVFVEQTRLEFRAEAYNLANSAHFAMPITNVNSIAFGQSLSTMPGLGPRTMQFVVKLVF
jgi:outer membrane receptor protein involved in Fe transport